MGPGPNYFSNSSDNVRVDDDGMLHLKITKRDDKWYCAEVVLQTSEGYGTYSFITNSRIDQLDKNIVLGMFTWDNTTTESANREFDIEYALWGLDSGDNGQFSVQPYTISGHTYAYTLVLTDNLSGHRFTWWPGAITFECSRNETFTDLVASWSFISSEVHNHNQEQARINLWLDRGRAPSNSQEAEVIIKRFQFTR